MIAPTETVLKMTENKHIDSNKQTVNPISSREMND